MSLRTPLAATVVGALLIGGAATGTTLALWRDSTTVAAEPLKSGYMTLTVGGGTTDVDLGSVSGLTLGSGGAAGAAVALIPAPELKLDSPTSAKNLRMQVFLDGVTAKPSGSVLGGALQVAARPSAAGACPPPAEGDWQPIGGSFAPKPLTSSSLAPQQSASLCFWLRLGANATATAQGQQASLTLTLRGEQTRS